MNAIRQQFGDGCRLQNADLTAIDGFHIRGKRATELLAAKLPDLSGKQVLDIGCAIGGTARFLAEKYHCAVTGLDITPAYIDIANQLAEMVGLRDNVQFVCGSALALPFPDHQFDVVWMEHMQMNIPEKSALLAEVHRVLQPGGLFVFHEVFAGKCSSPHFPVPWASTADESFLVTVLEFRKKLSQQRFRTLFWEDVTAQSAEWLAKSLQRITGHGFPPVGIQLLMGDDALEKLTNLSKNISGNKLQIVRAIVEAVAK